MRSTWMLIGSLVAMGCGRSNPMEADSAVTPAPVAAPEAPVKARTGMKLGIGFTANVLGELEPCGWKSHPLGGLAKKATLLNERRAKKEPAPTGSVPPTLLFDAGDALSPQHAIGDDQRARIVATAELIIKTYATQGVDAVAVGDRDLALGVDTLQRFSADSKVPFIATNLVDKDGKPVFQRSLVFEREGLKVLVLGLVGKSGARMAERTIMPNGLRHDPFIDAAKAALASTQPSPDLVVILSQLTASEEAELNAAMPEARVFLGGDAMGMMPELAQAGAGLSANGSQKGKHVGLLSLTFDDPRGVGAPLVDPGRKSALEAKKQNAELRIANLEKLIAAARAAPTDAAQAGAPDAGVKPVTRRMPVEAYERQLAGARAELQLTLDGLASLGPDTGDATASNRAFFQLVAMDPSVEDEPSTKAAIEAFRKIWPDPTKAPPPLPVDP